MQVSSKAPTSNGVPRILVDLGLRGKALGGVLQRPPSGQGFLWISEVIQGLSGSRLAQISQGSQNLFGGTFVFKHSSRGDLRGSLQQVLSKFLRYPNDHGVVLVE